MFEEAKKDSFVKDDVDEKSFSLMFVGSLRLLMLATIVALTRYLLTVPAIILIGVLSGKIIRTDSPI